MADLDYEGFFNEALIQLRNDLGEEEFGGWFSEMKYLRDGINSIVIGIPTTFHLDYIKSRYQNKFISILKNNAGKDLKIEYEIIGHSIKNETNQDDPPTNKNEPAVLKSATKPVVEKKKERHSHMRDDYTFSNYVIGVTNNYAANVAIAISRNPGTAFNPYLIFGGVGMGKTHLMQAIGNYIHENLDKEVIFTTSENFLNEYVTAIREYKMKQFQNKFRYTDVLLIDDIQFFQKTDKFQEEFFHTFNALLDAKKQLVFTCDRPVSELKNLEERLKSRFELCIKVDLQLPRYEERCAILKSVVESKNVPIPNDVIDFIGNNISTNVRDLKSAIINLIAFTEITKTPITVEIAQQHLKGIIYSPKQANLSIDNIIRVVAEHFSLTPNDLKGKKRTSNIVSARQLAMFICREMTDYSTTEIGQDFGGKDHTTVIHSIEKVRARHLTDPSLESTVNTLKQNIKEFCAKH